MIHVREECDALRDGTGRGALGISERATILAVGCLRIGYGMGDAVECRNSTGGRRVSIGGEHGGQG